MAVVAPICVASSVGICVVRACVRRVIHWWWLAQFNFQQVCVQLPASVRLPASVQLSARFNFEQVLNFQRVFNFQQVLKLIRQDTRLCPALPRMCALTFAPVPRRGWGPTPPEARVERFGVWAACRAGFACL